MKITVTCLLLTIALASGAAYAAKQDNTPREAEVQKDIDSIVSNCENKKLPTEKEIECIEKGFRQFMGVPDQDDAQEKQQAKKESPSNSVKAPSK